MEQKQVVKTITNRDGKIEKFDVSKIQRRLVKLANKTITIDDRVLPPINTDIVSISDLTIRVLKDCYDGIRTSELDILAANYCRQLIYQHPDFGRLASRIIISNLQKEVLPDVRSMAETLYRHKDNLGRHFPRISKRMYRFYCKHSGKLNSIIRHERDYLFDVFGAETAINTYLLKIIDREHDNNFPTKPAERLQHMWLRVAIQAKLTDDNVEWNDDIQRAYDCMSTMMFVHATPTLLNSGQERNQLVSCNLYSVSDSSEHIMDAAKIASLLSRDGAGLGFSVSDIRSAGSPILGTGGMSEGITNFAIVYGACMIAFNQGGGNRKGSMSITMEVWHADIFTFIDLKKSEGGENVRARTLFYAVYACDEFMTRVREDRLWSLMDPTDCPGLTSTWGDEFNNLYRKYESDGRFRKQIPARDLFRAITIRMIETGQPYFQFKDTINRKSNQQGWATIKTTNLCTEVAQPSGIINVRDPPPKALLTNPELPTPDFQCKYDEVANCNLASISLPAFVRTTADGVWFDFAELAKIAAFAAERLDECIDLTRYPIEIARETNMRHRPIGIGTQGLANVFYMMGIAWESEEAKILNDDIFEAIYYGAMTTSTQRAKKLGIYPTYQRSPAAMGYLQPDLWIVEELIKRGELPDLPIANLLTDYKDQMPPLFSKPGSRFDWETLRAHIAQFGLRNCDVTAPMPTASTSQLFGNYEGNDPAQANLFKRDTKVGSFIVANTYLIAALEKLGVWNADLAAYLVTSQGSIQKIEGIPNTIKNVFKTAWEIPQRAVVDLGVARGKYVSQNQSFNVHFADQPPSKLGTLLMYAWTHGLKGTYYVRSRAGAEAQGFAITRSDAAAAADRIQNMEKIMSAMQNTIWVQPKTTDHICLLCSS